MSPQVWHYKNYTRLKGQKHLNFGALTVNFDEQSIFLLYSMQNQLRLQSLLTGLFITERCRVHEVTFKVEMCAVPSWESTNVLKGYHRSLFTSVAVLRGHLSAMSPQREVGLLDFLFFMTFSETDLQKKILPYIIYSNLNSQLLFEHNQLLRFTWQKHKN